MHTAIIVRALPDKEFQTIKQIRKWLENKPAWLKDLHPYETCPFKTDLVDETNGYEIEIKTELLINDAEINASIGIILPDGYDPDMHITVPADKIFGRYVFDVVDSENDIETICLYIAPEDGFDPMKAFRTKNDDPDILYLIGPEHIGPEDWQRIAGEFHKCGYDIKDGEDAASLFTRHCAQCQQQGMPGLVLNNDQRDAIYRIFCGDAIPEETAAEKRRETEEYERSSIKRFGTTDSIRLAGYITPHGHLLNFSYEGHQRDMDHREIQDIMPDDLSGTNAMIAFMNLGNIRLSFCGADMSVKPTHQQMDMLRRALISACNHGDTFSIDLSAPSGYVVESRTYSSARQMDDLVDDINRYFDTGYIDA